MTQASGNMLAPFARSDDVAQRKEDEEEEDEDNDLVEQKRSFEAAG